MQWNLPAMQHNTQKEETAGLYNTNPPTGEEYFMRQYRVAQLLDNYKGTYEEWLESLDF